MHAEIVLLGTLVAWETRYWERMFWSLPQEKREQILLYKVKPPSISTSDPLHLSAVQNIHLTHTKLPYIL